MTLINKNIKACASLLTLIMMVGCASSSDTASTGESAALKGDPERVICRRENEIGSRLASRTCKTAREWEEERARNLEVMRNANKSPQAPGNVSSPGN